MGISSASSRRPAASWARCVLCHKPAAGIAPSPGCYITEYAWCEKHLAEAAEARQRWDKLRAERGAPSSESSDIWTGYNNADFAVFGF
jgi:hypothetical protein